MIERTSASDRTEHLVQFYGTDERALIANVTRFLQDGLNNGESLLIVATSGHWSDFRNSLRRAGISGSEGLNPVNMRFIDADEVVAARIDGDGNPLPGKLIDFLVAEVASVRESGDKGLRAYSDLTGVLWQRGQRTEA